MSGVYPLRELNPPARCTILYQPAQVVQGMYSEWCLPSEGAEPTSQMYNPLPTCPSCTTYVQSSTNLPKLCQVCTVSGVYLLRELNPQPDVQSSTNLPKLYQVCTVSGVYPLRELNPPARCTILYQPAQVVPGMYSEWCLPSEGAEPTSQMYNPLPTYPSCTRYVQ